MIDNNNVTINTNKHILDLIVFFPKSIIELIIITHIQVKTPLIKCLITSLFKNVSIDYEKDVLIVLYFLIFYNNTQNPCLSFLLLRFLLKVPCLFPSFPSEDE